MKESTPHNQSTWYTCTPVSFSGGPDFFARDSGLICKGLQSLGLKCKAIMPLPSHAGDAETDLLRTDAANLTRSEWWQDIRADRVVLYSWGAPEYKNVARAIRDSGAKLFINMDTSGTISPIVTPSIVFGALLGRGVRQRGPVIGTIYGLIRFLALLVYQPFYVEPERIEHLKAASAIGCISPAALTLMRLWARTFAPELVEKMHLVPHPISMDIEFIPIDTKRDQVISIGRWDDEEQKRPQLLGATIEEAAQRRNTTEFHIYGAPGRFLPIWHGGLSGEIKNRVFLHGKVAHNELVLALKSSRIGLCTSSHESSHIASEEALCAGGSIVGPFRKELNALLWYVSHDSGQLAVSDTHAGIAETLLLELDAWDRGERDPVEVSRYWRNQLSAKAVAEKISMILE
jgi:hypothetical protein